LTLTYNVVYVIKIMTILIQTPHVLVRLKILEKVIVYSNNIESVFTLYLTLELNSARLMDCLISVKQTKTYDERKIRLIF